jgi:tryptophan 2,3-dioxygenase
MPSPDAFSSSVSQISSLREIEFLAGVRDEAYLRFFQDRPEVVEQLRKRLAEPSVWDAFAALIGRRFPDRSLDDAIRQIYESHQDHLELFLLAESLVDFDEHLALWRFHHVRVVERVIGMKPGTGGSAGVAYLKTTVDKKAFPALWDVRAQLGVTAYGDGAR